MIEMKLTMSEARLVMASREKELQIMSYAELGRNCEHNMVYMGHGHNDDSYECTKCGYHEWR